VQLGSVLGSNGEGVVAVEDVMDVVLVDKVDGWYGDGVVTVEQLIATQ
jgi:hypothetical protein